jgi:hypothetical protein
MLLVLAADLRYAAAPSETFGLAGIGVHTRDDKGVAFLFFPGSEQYQKTTHELFPGGKDDEVTSRRGKHLFYTYVLTPSEAQATQK